MNTVKIEEVISALAGQPFDSQEFSHAFLEALIVKQMFTQPDALPVERELIPRGGIRLSGPEPFVANIAPKPCGPGFTGTRSQHLDRRVIGEDGLSLEDIFFDGVGKGFQQRGGFTNSTSHGVAVQINLLALIYLRHHSP